MANNITISTEDIGSGVQLDRTKIVIGVSGTDGGDVSSGNPLPVSMSSGVGGLGASGSAVTGNPVLVAGSDGTNTQTLSTDSSGRLYISNQRIAIDNVSSATYTTNGNSSTYDVSAYKYLLVGAYVTAITESGKPYYFYLQGEGPDGNWYDLNDDGATFDLGSNGAWMFAVGPGASGGIVPDMGTIFPNNVRIKWAFVGTSPSITFNYWIIGQP